MRFNGRRYVLVFAVLVVFIYILTLRRNRMIQAEENDSREEEIFKSQRHAERPRVYVGMNSSH